MQALTPLTLGISSVKASLLGAWWGFGHCIGQLILGIAMLLLKVTSPILLQVSLLQMSVPIQTRGCPVPCFVCRQK